MGPHLSKCGAPLVIDAHRPHEQDLTGPSRRSCLAVERIGSHEGAGFGDAAEGIKPISGQREVAGWKIFCSLVRPVR